jgi:hypothetical protein
VKLGENHRNEVEHDKDRESVERKFMDLDKRPAERTHSLVWRGEENPKPRVKPARIGRSHECPPGCGSWSCYISEFDAAISSRSLFVVFPSPGGVIVRIIVRIIRMMVVVVMVVMVMMIIGALVIIVVMMVMMMVMVRIIVVPILRQPHVCVSLGVRLGASGVRRVNGLQQRGRIRDRLEQLRIRPGAHDFGQILRG